MKKVAALFLLIAFGITLVIPAARVQKMDPSFSLLSIATQCCEDEEGDSSNSLDGCESIAGFFVDLEALSPPLKPSLKVLTSISELERLDDFFVLPSGFMAQLHRPPRA